MTETHVDLDAALLEGLAPMPAHLIPLRDESIALKEQIDELNARREDIKESFAKELQDSGLQGYILNGKVHARVSEVINTRVDAKELKLKMPHIYAKFLKVTKSVRTTVN